MSNPNDEKRYSDARYAACSIVIPAYNEADSIAAVLQDMQNIKKLKGHDNYYRLKISDYRLGFSYENGEINIIRFLHRKEIYKLFP